VDQRDAENLLTWMHDLYPSWGLSRAMDSLVDEKGGEIEPPGPLITEWADFLIGLGDVANVKQAIRRVMHATNYNPTMARIKEAHTWILGQRRAKRDDARPVAPSVWVVCVAGRSKGHYSGLYYPSKGAPGLDVQLQHAETLRESKALCSSMQNRLDDDWQIRGNSMAGFSEQQMAQWQRDLAGYPPAPPVEDWLRAIRDGKLYGSTPTPGFHRPGQRRESKEITLGQLCVVQLVRIALRQYPEIAREKPGESEPTPGPGPQPLGQIGMLEFVGKNLERIGT